MIAADVILLGLVAKHGVREGVREWLRVFPSLSAMDEWDESKHPRKDNGQFGTGSGEKQQEKVKNSSEELYQKAYERILSEVTPEVRKKMEAVNLDKTKDNIFPKLNEEDIKELGLLPFPVRLKRNIIERQESKHPEAQKIAKNILASALYSPDAKIPGKTEGYMHFLKQVVDDEHSLVLLDLQQSDDSFYDIVHYFKVDNRNKKRIAKNQNKRTDTEER